MKKFFLKEGGKEVKLGEKIQISTPVSTSYGEGKAQVEIEISPATLKKLVDDGFVIIKNDEPQKTEVQTFFENLKPYFRKFARKNDMSLSTCMGYFLFLFNTSKRALLLVLLETIAEVKNRDLKKCHMVYWLNPAANYNPVAVVGNRNNAIVFYSAKDALDAHKLLLPLIKNLVADEE
jgi:hypothetical protein